MKISAIGIPWYRRDDYAAIRKVMADGQLLPDTFDEWWKKAEQVRQDIERGGGFPVKAHLDSTTFPGWCAARGLNVDAHARGEFANRVAFEAVRRDGKGD